MKKKIFTCIATGLFFLATTGLSIAIEDTTVQQIQEDTTKAKNDASNAKNTADQLAVEIQNMKGGLPQLSNDLLDLQTVVQEIADTQSSVQIDLQATKDALATAITELTTTRQLLDETRKDLTETKADLANTSQLLTSTVQELVLTSQDLQLTKGDLVATQAELMTTKSSLFATQLELVQAKQSLQQTKGDVTWIQSDLTAAQDEFSADINDLYSVTTSIVFDLLVEDFKHIGMQFSLLENSSGGGVLIGTKASEALDLLEAALQAFDQSAYSEMVVELGLSPQLIATSDYLQTWISAARSDVQAGSSINTSDLGAVIETLESDMETVRNERSEFQTMFESFDQKANQLFNILSTVLKSIKEMKSSVTRNML